MFWCMKPLLMKESVSVNKRLHLFDATVASCVTCCCESWTPKVEEFRKLETARRSMLRKIVGGRRGPTEQWIDWMKRVTNMAIQVADRAGVRSWRAFHHERKWMWAGHVARHSAGSWLYRVTTWRDSMWQQLCEQMGVERERRPSNRRWMIWEDPLRRFCSASLVPPWTELAAHRDDWRQLAPTFVNWAA